MFDTYVINCFIKLSFLILKSAFFKNFSARILLKSLRRLIEDTANRKVIKENVSLRLSKSIRIFRICTFAFESFLDFNKPYLTPYSILSAMNVDIQNCRTNWNYFYDKSHIAWDNLIARLNGSYLYKWWQVFDVKTKKKIGSMDSFLSVIIIMLHHIFFIVILNVSWWEIHKFQFKLAFVSFYAL